MLRPAIRGSIGQRNVQVEVYWCCSSLQCVGGRDVAGWKLLVATAVLKHCSTAALQYCYTAALPNAARV
jgi:hypothetical protein